MRIFNNKKIQVIVDRKESRLIYIKFTHLVISKSNIFKFQSQTYLKTFKGCYFPKQTFCHFILLPDCFTQVIFVTTPFFIIYLIQCLSCWVDSLPFSFPIEKSASKCSSSFSSKHSSSFNLIASISWNLDVLLSHECESCSDSWASLFLKNVFEYSLSLCLSVTSVLR